ncbi:MAG: hypothetical protein Q7T41_02125 [Candidatus Saccharibacteria bacterium]|nr:hypothetical protein [Candidatus Saccharibacteria bacterium]
MARAVWETQVAPNSLSDEEAITILGCIEGEFSSQEVSITELQRLKVDHNL